MVVLFCSLPYACVAAKITLSTNSYVFLCTKPLLNQDTESLLRQGNLHVDSIGRVANHIYYVGLVMAPPKITSLGSLTDPLLRLDKVWG